MLLVLNQCKLRYNSKIQYLIRFVFDCAFVVNFRCEIQINNIWYLDLIFTTIFIQPLHVFILFLQVKWYYIVIWRSGKTHEAPCNDNWLLLLISFTNIFALLVTLSTLLESVGNLNLVYIIHIYNALENSLENATDGVLQKIINKNPDPAKLELYSL